MTDRPKILAFAGRTRGGSYQKRPVNVAAAGAREAGDVVVEQVVVELRMARVD